MKILHTSDWHLGHALYNYDRTEEQQSMLGQIEDIVKKQQPDVLLVCGDVYHTAQPSSAVQTMFAESIVRMHEACPGMTIVITAGNHDSGTRHEIFRTPWQALRVYAIGNLAKDNPEEHIIEIEGKGFIAAVPYSNERNIPDGWFQRLLDIISERNKAGLPVIMTAHATVRGSDFTGHDNATEYTAGGIDGLELDYFGDGYDYLALGHIHNGQYIRKGQGTARYCGTPLAVSFDERFSHSISIIETDRHGAVPHVETAEIRNIRPLVTLPSQGISSLQEALDLLKEFPADIPAYIRLNVEVEGFLPAEAYTEAEALAKGKKCRFCQINATRRKKQETEAKALTVQEFQSEAPIGIASRYAEDTGACFDEEMKELFNEILQMVAEDERN